MQIQYHHHLPHLGHRNPSPDHREKHRRYHAPPVSRSALRKTGDSAKLGKIQTALLGSIEPASTRRSSSGATPTVSTSFSAQRPPPPCASYVAELEVSTLARFEASAKTDKVRRFKEFFDGAGSWSRVERIFAQVEVGAQGADTRFIATNLAGGKAKALYEDVYCRRGAAENHIKSWKTHLAADRTSCTRATANQFRLFLHAGAYWLMWGLRAAMPKRSCFAVAHSTRCDCASSRSPRAWSR